MQWHALGNSHFRRWTPFDMTPWRKRGVSSLSDVVVAVAPFGGPLALLPRVSKPATETDSGRCLTIFTASGERLAEIPWEPFDAIAPLIHLSWTDALRLVAVLANGRGVSFTPTGNVHVEFWALPSTMQQDKIVRCERWNGGVVVLTDKMALIQVSVPVAGRPARYVVAENAVSASNPLTCMTVIEPSCPQSSHPEILIATADNMIKAVSFGYQRVFMHEPLDAPIALMAAPSTASSLLAIFTEDGVLTVLDTSCDSKIFVFNTQSKTTPVSMCWCGDDAVALYWPSTGVVLVGLSGSWLRFSISQSDKNECVLVQEIDCCRVYHATGHDVFIRVPPSMERAKRRDEGLVAGTAVDTDSATALLLQATAASDAGDHDTSDALYRTLKRCGTLQVAIDDCIDAAGHAFDHTEQTLLLEAAMYGREQLEDHEDDDATTAASSDDDEDGTPLATTSTEESDATSDSFTKMCRTIRVLNALRQPDVGLPLTMEEYETLGVENVMRRLVTIRQRSLAQKMCEFLGISADILGDAQ